MKTDKAREAAEVLQLADDQLTKNKLYRNHVTTQMNKKEIISYNTGYLSGYQQGYLAAMQASEDLVGEVNADRACAAICQTRSAE